MGHQRLGKLPTHRYLPDIVRYLVTGGTPTAHLVEQITEVGRDALKRALKDPVFVEALWLLIRLPQAAASRDFGAALAEIGMGALRPTSVAELMVAFDNALERVQRREHRDATDLGEIARQAALTALGDAVRAGMPMWSPTADDVQASVAALRSPEKFGALAHHFHANTVERVIHYYVDRNLHELVGADRVVSSVHDLATYGSAIRRHCMEAALIMRAFARDWLGKNQYRDGKDISKNDARKFSAYAVEKISIELKNRKGPN